MRPLVNRLINFIMVAVAGCTFSTTAHHFKDAKEKDSKGLYEEALESYSAVLKIAPETEDAIESARRSAHITRVQLQSPKRAIEFYRHLVLYSRNETERANAQKAIAEIYFDKLNDYENAQVELLKYLEMNPYSNEAAPLRMMLARAYFFKGNHYQARTEIDLALKADNSDEMKFKGELLRANIFVNEKKLDEAIVIYKKLMTDYPEQSKTEQVGLSLSVCYEEKQEIDLAIQVLESVKADYSLPDMINLKINRLKERKMLLPGAKGLKK